MAEHLSLDKLRDTVLANRATGRDLPEAAEHKVMVDRNAKIVDADLATGTAQELSEVHQGTFA